MSHYSFTSIDVGFDLRLHDDMTLALPADVTSVEYQGAGHQTHTITGTRDQIRTALEAAGYRVEKP